MPNKHLHPFLTPLGVAQSDLLNSLNIFTELFKPFVEAEIDKEGETRNLMAIDAAYKNLYAHAFGIIAFEEEKPSEAERLGI